MNRILTMSAVMLSIASPSPALADETMVKTDWVSEYHRGIRTADTGVQIGNASVAGLVAGFTLFFVGFATNPMEDIFQWQPSTVQITGFGMASAGVLGTEIGAVVAASGTSKSHRALVKGGLKSGPCSGCTIGWLLTIPNPMYVATIPSSYIASRRQRAADAELYQAHSPQSDFRLRVTPIATQNQTGLAVSGQF